VGCSSIGGAGDSSGSGVLIGGKTGVPVWLFCPWSGSMAGVVIGGKEGVSVWLFCPWFGISGAVSLLPGMGNGIAGCSGTGCSAGVSETQLCP